LVNFLSLLLIVYGISRDYNVAHFGGPLPEAIVLLLAFYVLFLNEMYQVSLIGLKDFDLQQLERFPYTKRVRDVVFDEATNMNHLPRIFLGQSFMVVSSTFIISQLTTFAYFPSVDGLPEWMLNAFVRSGLPGVVLTVNMIQLLPSVLAQKHPAASVNSAFGVLTAVRAALFIEHIGIVHATWLIVWIFEHIYFAEKVDKSKLETQKALLEDGRRERNLCNSGLSYTIKLAASGMLWVLCLGFVLYNLVGGRSEAHLHPIAATLLLLLAYVVIFYCEGLKVAIVSSGSTSMKQLQLEGYPIQVLRLVRPPTDEFKLDLETFSNVHTDDGEEIDTMKSSIKCTIPNKRDDRNSFSGTDTQDSEDNAEPPNLIPNFLLGRQLIVVLTNFFVANLTLFAGYESNPLWYFLLVVLNLPGMLLTMQLCQLAPQVLASGQSKKMLRLPLGSLLIRLALAVEKLGITECAFVVIRLIEGAGLCRPPLPKRVAESEMEPVAGLGDGKDASGGPYYESTEYNSPPRRV
jgi:uncharacterized protein YqhQ